MQIVHIYVQLIRVKYSDNSQTGLYCLDAMAGLIAD